MSDPADPRRRSIDIDIEYLMAHLRGHTMRLRPDARWISAAPSTHLRVSDAERNEVADRLSRHFAEGRLDQAEFKERLDAAMSAKTQGDLAGLFDDLPPLASEPVPIPVRRRRLVPFLLLVALLAVVTGSTFSTWHLLHVPWLLLAVVVFFVWHRAGRHHHHDR